MRAAGPESANFKVTVSVRGSSLIDGPLVQPMADDDFLVPTDFDGPEVMPLVFVDGGFPGGFDPAGDPVILSLILELEANPMISYGPRGPHLNSEENYEVHRPGLDHWA